MGGKGRPGTAVPVAWIHSEEQGTGKVRQPVKQDVEAKFSGAGGYIQLPVRNEPQGPVCRERPWP